MSETTDKEVKCCVNCEYFNYAAPQHDQPSPEFWCGKGEWDGIASEDELYAKIDCELYTPNHTSQSTELGTE